MDRVFSLTILLSIVLLIFGIWNEFFYGDLLSENQLIWLVAGFLVAVAIGFFALSSRWMSYAQAHSEYLRIVTPFLKLKISYRRILRIHPSLIQQIFSKDSAGWSEKRFLNPFYGKTAIVIEVRKYPLNPAVLRFFLPCFMFNPKTPGFVLVVPDWMNLSTEIDTLYGVWLQNQKLRDRRKT